MGFLTKVMELLVASVSLFTDFDAPAERVLKLAPNLFRVLWDHRNLLRCDRMIREHKRSGRSYDSGEQLIGMSGACVVSLTLLHKQVRFVVFSLGLLEASETPLFLHFRSQPPPVHTLQAQLLLFIWTYGPKHAPHAPLLKEDLITGLNSILISTERMKALVKDVISSTDTTKIHPDDLTSRFLPLLQSPHEIDGSLRSYFILIQGLSCVPGTFSRVQSHRLYGIGLAESICIACQRQLCSGGIEYDDSVLGFCLRNLR